MATRTSSSSSSSETEVTTTRVRGVSETSANTVQSDSRHHQQSSTNTIDGTSIADTTTVRSASPTSHASATATRTAYDAASVTTTSNTIASQSAQLAGGIPIIRPPVLPQQQSGTGIGVFGPQRPVGYPTQPPIHVDVASAQQQYQQHVVQTEISPSSK